MKKISDGGKKQSEWLGREGGVKFDLRERQWRRGILKPVLQLQVEKFQVLKTVSLGTLLQVQCEKFQFPTELFTGNYVKTQNFQGLTRNTPLTVQGGRISWVGCDAGTGVCSEHSQYHHHYWPSKALSLLSNIITMLYLLPKPIFSPDTYRGSSQSGMSSTQHYC